MHCSLCFSSDRKLQTFHGDMDNDTFKRIVFVLPDFSIPEAKDSVFVCATCLEQVSYFYRIKNESLQNCCRLKHFNAVLKATNNIKFNELNITINSGELSTHRGNLVEIKVEPNLEDLFLSEEIDPTLVIKEEKVDDYNSKQRETDGSNLYVLKDDESSSSSEESTQNDKNVGSYEFVDINKLTEKADQDATHIKEEDKEYAYYSQQLVNGESSSNYSSSNSNNSAEKHNSHVDKFAKKDSYLPYNDNHHEDQSKTHRDRKEKRFKCTDCQKSFTWRKDLKRHTRIHSGEKPYKCTTCQKQFTLIYNLNRHTLTHTGQKPHECDVCHKTFNQKSQLLTHEQTHTDVRPYQCAVCNKAFIKSGQLNTHMRTHPGEKPHQCHLCLYKSARAGDLKTHMRYHSGEKPYSCKHCEKSFTTTSHLKEHERRLH